MSSLASLVDPGGCDVVSAKSMVLVSGKCAAPAAIAGGDRFYKGVETEFARVVCGWLGGIRNQKSCPNMRPTLCSKGIIGENTDASDEYPQPEELA
ncbi:MAG: hypothetical protein AABZ67_06605 [Pseudomonadota bacterium]